MYAVILAGGVGTRLWPRSRQAQPKQFSQIQGDGLTMIQSTVDRLQGLIEPENVYIVTGVRYAGLAHEQLPAVPESQILAEPSGRNTAPALGLACLYLRRRNPDAVLAVLPSDHAIARVDVFQAALRRARELATTQHSIVTLGIQPDSPHTGYGYIQRSDSALDAAQPAAYDVVRFVEKPPQATAAEFVRSGQYYWNAGMFVFRVQTMLDEIARQAPQLYAGLQEIDAALDADPVTAQQVLQRVWPTLPSISIDHGVMEGAEKVTVIPLDAGWNDVGSWDALETVIPPDETGNISAGGQVIPLDSKGNIVYAAEAKIVALIGVEDLVVVDTGDAILVGKKQEMQRVKEIVDSLAKSGRHQVL